MKTSLVFPFLEMEKFDICAAYCDNLASLNLFRAKKNEISLNVLDLAPSSLSFTVKKQPLRIWSILDLACDPIDESIVVNVSSNWRRVTEDLLFSEDARSLLSSVWSYWRRVTQEAGVGRLMLTIHANWREIVIEVVTGPITYRMHLFAHSWDFEIWSSYSL